MTQPADCRLVPVPPDGPLREQVLRLAPTPEQEVFSGRAEQTLRLAERDPDRVPYTLVEDGVPVGFLVLDRSAGGDELLLRGFFVDAAAQGRGVATRMVALLPDRVRADFPGVRTVRLTVNVRNPVARAVYLRGGFADHGELFLGGSAGPQHVLRLDLNGEVSRAAG